MPQLNPEFFISQLFWLVIFFSFLFVFLWRISLPRIALVLEKRQGQINDNLSKAKEIQEKALDIENKINLQITTAKNQNDEHLKEAIKSIQDDVSAKLLSIDKELEDKIAKSEKDIIKNRDNEMKNINEEIAKLTKITIAKIADISLSDSDIDQVVKSYKGSIN
tara:strand:+ start:226 stop:717 length:492 start_codon:yes stop_codon:yes gene_type:complete